MNQDRAYYAQRHGLAEPGYDLHALKRAVLGAIETLRAEGLFQTQLGYECVDAGFVPGDVGEDVEAFTLYMTGVQFWPLEGTIDDLEEFELFTAIEFLHDHATEPAEWTIHSFDGCGIHVEVADSTKGQARFRERLNPLLGRYGQGYELTDSGELWTAETLNARPEIEPLGDTAVDERVASAMAKFRRYGAQGTDRRDAVRELADVLEYLRATFETELPRWDEDRLFEIANQYGIRHHNQKQKTDYDEDIWLSWIYYTYLNAIDLMINLIKRDGEYENTRCPACHQLTLRDDAWAETDSDGITVGGNSKSCSNCSYTLI